MGIVVTNTATCDCCGYSLSSWNSNDFQYLAGLDKYLCTAKGCFAAHSADLLTGSFNLAKTRHTNAGGSAVTHPALPNTCDCCGFVFDPTAAGTFTYDEVLGKTLCAAKLCNTKYATELLTGSFNATKTTHTVLIIGGVIPNHP